MPFNSNSKAKTGADGNCGLHCFIPSVAAIFNEGTHIVEKNRMALAFKNYYNITTPFSRDTLRDVIQNTKDPIEREALLAPVLRQMMVDRMRQSSADTDQTKPTEEYIASVSQANTPLFDTDLHYLADDLGISLEAYAPQNNSVDTLNDRKHNVLAFPPKAYAQAHLLKIKNDNSHWEFERLWSKDAAENKQLLDEHNAKYQDKVHRFNTEVLRERVKSEIEAGHTRLSRIFAEPDISLKTPGKPATNDMFGNIASTLKNTFGGIASTLKDSFNGITSKIGNVVNKVGHAVKGMVGNSAASPDPFTATFGGLTSKVGSFMKNLFGSLGSKPGQKDDIFSSLFKMLANLFQSIMGFFGQSPQAVTKKETPKLRPKAVKPITHVTRKADGQKRQAQPVASELNNRFSELLHQFGQTGNRPSEAAQSSHSGQLAQFQRKRSEALRLTTEPSVAPKAVASVSY